MHNSSPVVKEGFRAPQLEFCLCKRSCNLQCILYFFWLIVNFERSFETCFCKYRTEAAFPNPNIL